MKKLYLIFFVFVTVFSKGQIVNYVQNPSFETISTCNFGGLIKYALHWDTLKSGGGGSPDLFNSCDVSTNHYYSVPRNLPVFYWAYQKARTGVGYCGYISYVSSANVREYVQNKLSNTLINGKTYCVKFYVNQTFAGKYSINQFGAYIDDGSVSTSSNGIIILTPQVSNPITNYLTDTLNWMLISGTFTANGTEKYITLGNFASNVQTDTLAANPSTTNPEGYYFVDDVSVIATDLPCVAGKDTSMCTGDSVYVGRPPEIGLDNVWHEIHSNQQVGVGAGIWVKSDTSATYVVTQDLCGTITHDTVRVLVNCVGIEQFKSNKLVRVYPNPTNNSVSISSSKNIDEVKIMDLLGNECPLCPADISPSGEKTLSFDISTLQNGIYFVSITSGNEKTSRKLVVSR